MSWKGEARFHCERTDEDPRGDPPEPEMDDWPEPDPPRDFFAEAVAIAAFEDKRPRLMPQREHLIAVIERLDEVEGELRRYKRVSATGAIFTARAQAARVANPVTREELRECLNEAERLERTGKS